MTTSKVSAKKTKVLVAPLDWGLGHAARCIQIIKELLLNGYEVIIACDGPQLQLLTKEFPLLYFVNLEGYKVSYGRNSFFTALKIIIQFPKILIQINREKKWLDEIISKEKIDMVISDNRYGLCSTRIISVFVTHQLYIKTPFGRIGSQLLQKINYKYINKFNFCWLPDFPEQHQLAGNLSHPKKKPGVPVHYVGLLSRFETRNLPIFYKLMFVISGPEPQRTIFENIILKELRHYKDKAILIRGLPDRHDKVAAPSNIDVFNHLRSTEMNDAICASELVICRSGYSSIMDLSRLGKKSILIPTPGQTEQEYLADYLYQKKYAIKIKQKDFCLEHALAIARAFPYKKYNEERNDMLTEAIRSAETKRKEKISSQPQVPGI